MANEKLTWAELRKAVAQMASVSEQESEQFLSALVEATLKGLEDDKQVKIKGIGTFALKAIAPRKSVNIATGEEFVIEGYNKLTFNAESMLKESVEKRLEQPKTETIVSELNNDPIKKLGKQATEIVDLLAELGQAVSQPAAEDLAVEKIVEVPKVLEEKTEEMIEEPATEEPTEEPTPEPIEEPTEEPAEEVVEPTAEPTSKPVCKCHKWVCWLIGALLLLGIVGTGFYFRAPLMQWWQCMQDCQPTIEIEEEVQDGTEGLESSEVQEVTLANKPREYVNFIGIERVGNDSRLAWIAYKYYAQKDLWVFIYEANRDIIKHPAHVRPGQHIRIPELSEEYRNLYNPELKQLVDSLAIEYLR